MTKFVKITVSSKTGRFPSGYEYVIPSTEMPDDVARIWADLGGKCLLYTSKFAVTLEGMSCLGLAYVTSFLGDHPYASRVYDTLQTRALAIRDIYDAIIEYSQSSSNKKHIILVSSLSAPLEVLSRTEVMTDPFPTLIIKVIDILMSEMWKVPVELISHIPEDAVWVLTKENEKMMGMMSIGVTFAMMVAVKDEDKK